MTPDQADLRTDPEPEHEAGPERDAERAAATRPPTVTPPGRPVLLIVLAVVALLGIFGTVFFFSKYRALSNRDPEKSAVTKVSQQFLLALTNFNASTLDDDLKRIQSYATGDFQGQALRFFSADFRNAAAKVQATSRGQINALFVESINGGTATTYALVDQTIANLKFAQPEQDQLRIVLTLVKTPQGWKVSEVTLLQGPTTPTPPSTTAPTTAATPTGAPTSPATLTP